MKMNVASSGILIGAKSKEYAMQNGSKGTTYSLALEHCDEVGNLKCSKNVFDAVVSGQFPKYAKVLLVGVYDTDYRNMVIESVELSDKK